jgi:hypothetical protein
MLSSQISYSNSLMMQDYIANFEQGFIQANNSSEMLMEMLDDHVDSILDTMMETADKIVESIDFQSYVIKHQTDSVILSLGDINTAINSLRSSFDISMGKVLLQFDIMRSEINNSLSKIIDLMENSRKVEAWEHFRDAMEFYKEGCMVDGKPKWFKDALKHFILSVEKYERNPIAHLHIAHIYHYQQELQNFDKALEHYRNCYVYGESDESSHDVAAQGYFYAGWLSASVFGDLDNAVSLTSRAIELDKNISEAYYHLSKFLSLKGDPASSIAYLERAILKFDRNYAIKAVRDVDFSPIRSELDGMILKFKEDTKLKIESILNSLDFGFDPKDRVLRDHMREMQNKLHSLLTNDTYFALLDALPQAQRLAIDYKDVFNNAKTKKAKFYDPVIIEVNKITDFLQSDTNSQRFKRYEGEIARIQALLEKDDYTQYDKAYHLACSVTKEIDQERNMSKARKLISSLNEIYAKYVKCRNDWVNIYKIIASSGNDLVTRVRLDIYSSPNAHIDYNNDIHTINALISKSDSESISRAHQLAMKIKPKIESQIALYIDEIEKANSFARNIRSKFIIKRDSINFDVEPEAKEERENDLRIERERKAREEASRQEELRRQKEALRRQKEALRRQKEALRRQEESKLKAEEFEYRKKNKLCVLCGEPIGFFLRLNGSLHCSKHK